MNRIDFDFRVPACHPALSGHFPGHPIVPGVLMLDYILMNLQRASGRHAACLQQVKFMSALQPEELAHALCEFEGERASFRLTARRNGTVVTLARGSISLQLEKSSPE